MSYRDEVFLVSISGIPGAGKSTALKKLIESRALDIKLEAMFDNVKVCYFLEPSEEWERDGHLQNFYGDPDTYALAFQTIVFVSHNNGMIAIIDDMIRKNPGNPLFCVKTTSSLLFVTLFLGKLIVCIADRSVWDQLLFWRQQVELGRKCAIGDGDIAYTGNWQLWRKTLPAVSHIFMCKIDDIQIVMENLKGRGKEYEIGADGMIEQVSVFEIYAWNLF